MIDNSAYPVIYANTWYLDCVSSDWSALVWPSAQRYEIVMPLPIKRKWGIPVVQQPLFCQYLGLFSREEISEEATKAFLVSLSGHFSYISAYDFHPRHTPLLRKLLPAQSELKISEKATHWLSLAQPYRVIANRYTNDRKKNLKKSEKYNWECHESDDVEPLINLFRKNQANKIQNVKESAYILLRNLCDLVLEKKAGSIQYAILHEEIRAGIMVLVENGVGIYIFNAADAIGRKGNARTFLLDRYFRQTAGRIQVFDFESPDEESIARFYESFGAEKQAFISVKKNKLPFPLRHLQEFRKWLFLRRRSSP